MAEEAAAMKALQERLDQREAAAQLVRGVPSVRGDSASAVGKSAVLVLVATSVAIFPRLPLSGSFPPSVHCWACSFSSDHPNAAPITTCDWPELSLMSRLAAAGFRRLQPLESLVGVVEELRCGAKVVLDGGARSFVGTV